MAQPLAIPTQLGNNDMNPLAGGLVYTYEAGSLTPKASYTTADASTPNANPVVLDSSGRAHIYLQGYYRIIIRDSNGVLIDDLDGIQALSATGDMNTSVYDPANIGQQVLGVSAVQNVSNKTFGTGNAFTENVNFAKGASSGLQVKAIGTNSRTSTTTLTDVTGLSVTLEAGKTYRLEAEIFTTSNVAGGVKLGTAGTATFSTYRAVTILFDSSANSTNIIGNSGTAGALGGQTATTTAMVLIKGQFIVNTGGTYIIQFAQNASNASASSITSATLTVTPLN